MPHTLDIPALPTLDLSLFEGLTARADVFHVTDGQFARQDAAPDSAAI